MTECLVEFWNQLSPDARAVLTFIFDKQLGATVAVLLALLSWLSRKKIGRTINRIRARRNLKNRLPDFTKQEIERGIRYYIWPDCQSVDPTQGAEIRHTVAVRNRLCREMDRLLNEDTQHKHYFLLADRRHGQNLVFVELLCPAYPALAQAA